MVHDHLGMATLSDLETQAPAIAAFFQKKVSEAGIIFLATTRSDGWPRVSPMELTIFDGRLFAGSMPQAVKAKDLQRDPRCCLITPLADKDDLAGEAKLFCRAVEVGDGGDWDSLRSQWQEELGFDVGEPGDSHIFEFHVEAAAFQRVEGDDWRTTSWREGSPVGERVRTGPLGESRDL